MTRLREARREDIPAMHRVRTAVRENRLTSSAITEAMVSWLRSRGLERLWLTTEPGTRAESFYRAAGWRAAGRTRDGQVRYELE